MRVLAILLLATGIAYAHDSDGHWARLSAEGKAPPKEWWEMLSSGKGLCCSFADGHEIRNVDWDTQKACERGEPPNGERIICSEHYRVRLDGKWIIVPNVAVVTEGNRFGPAVVWPYKDAYGEIQIRCFLPSAMS